MVHLPTEGFQMQKSILTEQVWLRHEKLNQKRGAVRKGARSSEIILA